MDNILEDVKALTHFSMQSPRDAWKDLGNIMLEERWRIEERKEIIGEEWRKISRILDR